MVHEVQGHQVVQFLKETRLTEPARAAVVAPLHDYAPDICRRNREPLANQFPLCATLIAITTAVLLGLTVWGAVAFVRWLVWLAR